jgi:transposase
VTVDGGEVRRGRAAIPSAEEAAAMIALYDQGLCLRAVAARVGASYAVVRAVMDEAGVLRPPGPRTPAGVDVDRLVAAYTAGATLHRVAAMARCGPHRAMRHLRAAGVNVPARTPKALAEAIVSLYGQGLSIRAVATRLVLSYATVWVAVNEAGIARAPGNQVVEADMAPLAARYEAGATLAELSAVTGWSKSHVARRLRLVGVTIRRSGRRRERVAASVGGAGRG